MNKSEQIRRALKDLSSRYGPAPTLFGTVMSVDEVNQTCVLQDDDDDGTVYNDVRLRPVLDGNNSTTLIPTINTWALAIRIEGGEDGDWMLIAAGQIDKVIFTCGGFVFTISNTGYAFKSNTDSLKNILSDFIQAVQQITVNAAGAETTVPLNAAAFTDILQRLNTFMNG